MKRRRRRWTILAYFAGETSLSEAMIAGIKDIYRVGISPHTNVVVQYNPKEGPPRRFDLSEMASPVHRPLDGPRAYDKDGRLERFGRQVPVGRQPQTDNHGISVSQSRINRAVLEGFVLDGIRGNESDRYALIVSGHASGVVGLKAEHPGFAPGAMRTVDLARMLRSVKTKTGRSIDVLGLDACLMSMCEVCWELKDSVDYLVASEGFTSPGGWPYHRVLEAFQKDDDLTPNDAACAIVVACLRYYADFVLADRSADFSACDLSRVRPLAGALKQLALRLAEELASPSVRDAVVLSHWRAQSYKSDQYADLWDFCDLLRDTRVDEQLCQACDETIAAISDPVRGAVRNSVYSGPGAQHSHGLSIYFPWSEVSPAYADFGFGRTTTWAPFLASYCQTTRREMRGVKRPKDMFRYPQV
jgi:hypothetical protein